MKVLAAVGASLVLAFLVGLVIIGGSSGATQSAAETTAIAVALAQVSQQDACSVSGPLGGSLTAEQSSDAETIVSVSDTLSHENNRAARIALMTSLTESRLNNIDGGEGGAYGLFQQTPPGWGTVAQIMDPTYATTQFVSHLLAVSGWPSMTPWGAAQVVQRSGAGQPDSPENPEPGVPGGNYAVNWAKAGQVLAKVSAKMTRASCGDGAAGGPHEGEVGPSSRYGLPVGYHLPKNTTSRAALAVRYAISKLGDAYVWAATGPDAFDCSGLTMMAWAQAGIALDHYTVSQEEEGLKVLSGQIVAGDLVLVPGDDAPGPGLPGHVGIYLGDALVLSAVDPQYGVIVQSWATFTGGGLDAIVDPLLPPVG
jgi:hypothetical protein